MSQAKRIEAILLKGGAYVRDICKEVGIANNSFHAIYTDYIKKRHDVRRIHIPAWDKSSYIVIGQEAEDAFRAMVKAELPKRLEERRKARNALRCAMMKKHVGCSSSPHDERIKRLLLDRPMTSKEVAAKIGLSRSRVGYILGSLAKREEVFTKLIDQGPSGIRVYAASRAMLDFEKRVWTRRPRKSQEWKESGATEWKAPVVVKPSGMVGDIVIPEGVKVIRCPSVNHDPRYQVGPRERVPSIFRSIPYGATL